MPMNEPENRFFPETPIRPQPNQDLNLTVRLSETTGHSDQVSDSE